MQRSSLIRQVFISILIVSILAGIGFLLTRPKPTASADAPNPSSAGSVSVSPLGEKIVRIETEPVRAESLESTVRATGQVLFPADSTVKISPRLQGRVRAVYVKVGDKVAVGQPLALLDSVDAAAAQTGARQNENKLRQAKANLDRQERLYHLGTPDVTTAQAGLDQARARTQYTADALARIKEQASIGGFTEKPLEDAQTSLVSANSDLAQAQSDLAQAQRDRDRKVKLVDIGVAARSDMEASDNVLEKARVAVQSDMEKVALAKQAVEREKKAFKSGLYSGQQVRSAESDYRQAQLQEEAAERALRLAKAAVRRDVEQARSDYEAARVDAENSHRVLELLGHPGADGTLTVRAPIRGTVVDRQVSPGQIVDQSQMTPWQMFTLSNAETVWVDADVYEKDINRIAPGQPVRIHVGAFAGQEFQGVIRHIAPTLDPKSRTVKVRAEIPNRLSLLKDGMYADMIIKPKQGRAVVTVPLSALLRDSDTDYVYVAYNGKYARRQVQVGEQRNDRAIVEKGLQAGDTVVTHGAMFLGGQTGGG